MMQCNHEERGRSEDSGDIISWQGTQKSKYSNVNKKIHIIQIIFYHVKY